MNNYFLAVITLICAYSGLVFFNTPHEHFINAYIASAAYISMAMSLILAARIKLLDYLLAGPDKCYLIHRYFGYCAVIFSLLHWVTADDALSPLIPALADSAGDLGEFAISCLLLLVLISVLKLIPYQWWKKSHLLMGPVFLLISIHSFFSAGPIEPFSAFWWALLALSISATLAWLRTLTLSIATPKKAIVSTVNKQDGMLDLTIEYSDELIWKPGQFAQISVNKLGLTESHPFSIASDSKNSSARFIINQAGDFTTLLHQTIAIGDEIHIHQIAGAFTPQTSLPRKRQVWIATGSGITPFLAALNAMQADQGPLVELIYYPGKKIAKSIVKELVEYQKALPQFNLTLLSQGEYLSASHFQSLKDGWITGELYLCGTQSMKQVAQQVWCENQAAGKIHTELFDFRGAKSFTQVFNLVLSNKVITFVAPRLNQQKGFKAYKKLASILILIF